MPVIFVNGTPDRYPKDKLKEFLKELQNAGQDNPSLRLRPNQVSVFFPEDRLKEGLGEEIIIFVKGLFDYSSRTLRVRNEYAEILGKIAKKFFPKALLVECFIETFKNMEQGFWSSID